MYGNSASALSNFNPQTLASVDNFCPNRPLLCWPVNKLLFLPIIPAVVNNSLQSRAFLPQWFLYITMDMWLTILLPLSPSLLFLGWPRQISFRLVLGSLLHVLICFFSPPSFPYFVVQHAKIFKLTVCFLDLTQCTLPESDRAIASELTHEQKAQPYMYSVQLILPLKVNWMFMLMLLFTIQHHRSQFVISHTEKKKCKIFTFHYSQFDFLFAYSNMFTTLNLSLFLLEIKLMKAISFLAPQDES